MFFFFNDTATTEIYTLSLHDALPISIGMHVRKVATSREEFTSARITPSTKIVITVKNDIRVNWVRSEEHTSELQSQSNLVCRLLLEKKKNSKKTTFLTSNEAKLGKAI